MKRPLGWTHRLLVVIGLLVVAQYLALIWLAPRYVLRAVQRLAGGTMTMRAARLSFPLTTTLSGLQLAQLTPPRHGAPQRSASSREMRSISGTEPRKSRSDFSGQSEAWGGPSVASRRTGGRDVAPRGASDGSPGLARGTPQVACSIQRVTITPQWFSVPLRSVWVDRIEIEHALLRLARTPAGAFLWPSLPEGVRRSSAAGGPSAWRMHVDALQLTEGIIELVDERPPVPFHGVCDHLSVVAGPITIPWEGAARMSIALRGRFVGSQGHAAPFYCSGWMDVGRRDLEGSCTLEPLALAAFEPYFQGPPEIRISQADLALTTHWSATGNALRARIQVELGHLHEGAITVNGRMVVKFKELFGVPDTRLLGEITLAGPLDDPARWYGTFLPGNEPMQRVITRWLEHGVQTVTLPLGDVAIPVSLVPANQATMTEIQATRKAIREALEILTVPVPEEPLAPAPTPDSSSPSVAVVPP